MVRHRLCIVSGQVEDDDDEELKPKKTSFGFLCRRREDTSSLKRRIILWKNISLAVKQFSKESWEKNIFC